METINNNFCWTCHGYKVPPTYWASSVPPQLCTCSNGTSAEEFFRKKLGISLEHIETETIRWAKEYDYFFCQQKVQEGIPFDPEGITGKETPKETIDVSNLNKKCVYWRWKEKSSCLSKSYVRNVIETQQGATIIELANDEYSNALHRVLLSEIEIYTL